MAHRSGLRPGFALLSLALLAGCRRPPAPAPAPLWTVVAVGVEAPAGAPEAGPERCQSDGSACVALEAGAALTGDYTLRTPPGARAFVDLGDGVTLEMGGQASASFAGGEHPRVTLARGPFAMEAAPATSSRVHVDVGRHALVIDRALPASIGVRAGEVETAVVVRRGRATLDDGIAIRSGESARVREDRAVELGIGAGLDPDLAGRSEEPGHDPVVARGFGAMTARVPGTTEIVAGVRLVTHHVSVVVRDGFARTEVEEEFENDTARVLEGRFVFPVPPDASLSRLALWVGKDLVEGEIVERKRAAAIFEAIVDDSVRPRDPALLEWVKGSELSLKVFPILPHDRRKVVLAYEQALAAPAGRARYVYPLSLGADRAARVGDFAIHVAVERAREGSAPGYAAVITPGQTGIQATFASRDFTPPADFVFAWEDVATPEAEITPASWSTTREEDRFVAVRVPVAWPEGAASPPHPHRDRAIVVDVSHSQSSETLAGEAAVATGLVARLDPGERFVLLACDSGCVSYPEDGLAAVSEPSIEEARTWLARRATGGSSDVAGALEAAARRLDAGGAGQIVYLGDGAATSGELAAVAIAARVKPELAARGIDLRLVGAGRTVDEVVLAGLAGALGASYERLADGDPLARRVEDLALAMRAPVLREATLETPPGLHDVYPRVLPSLRAGQDLLVVGRLSAGATGEVRLRGDLGGASFAQAAPLPAAEDTSRTAGRIWAAARIAELEGSGEPAAVNEVVALSRRHHVLSRHTSLLVLENDRMFAEFGIERTRGQGGGKLTGSHVAREGSGSGGELGLLGMLSDGAAMRSALSSASNASGPLGAGGLGLSGYGEGGGGRGSGSMSMNEGPSTLHHDFSSGTAPAVPGPRGSEVHMSAASIPGDSIGADRFSGVVRGRMARLRSCYNRGLASDPTLVGRVSVRVVVGRDGWVTQVSSAGSTLPQPVVTCVLDAFRSLLFPREDGGDVTFVVPLNFAPGTQSVAAPPPAPNPAPAPPPRLASPWPTVFDSPSAVHRAGEDGWMTQGEDALQALRRSAGEENASRRRHEALIRGLLGHGRFVEALAAARRFADLDPDLLRARELLAGAAAAAGEAELARTVLDSEVELAPQRADLHHRAARAFEAVGDEARACAHWQSLAELRPGADEARYQALRCRARLGERDAIARGGAAEGTPGKLVAGLLASLQAGPSPAYDMREASPGEMEATVRCPAETAGCPDVVLVKPSGDVVSPWSPAPAQSSARSAAFAGLTDGVYRTVLVGGSGDAEGEVTVRALSAVRTFRFERGGPRTVAVTTVSLPPR